MKFFSVYFIFSRIISCSKISEAFSGSLKSRWYASVYLCKIKTNFINSAKKAAEWFILKHGK